MRLHKILHETVYMIGILLFVMVASSVAQAATGIEWIPNAVISHSMEPTYNKGDGVILSKYTPDTPLHVGDIIRYETQWDKVPILHRVHWIGYEFPHNSTGIRVITKGDRNKYDDRSLYHDQRWLTPYNITGVAYLRVPYLGWPSTLINDYPIIRYGVYAVVVVYLLAVK